MPYMNKICAISALNIIQGLLLVLPLQFGNLGFAVAYISYSLTYDLIQYTNKRFYRVTIFFIVLLLSLIVQEHSTTPIAIVIGFLLGLMANVRKIDTEVSEQVNESSMSALLDVFIDRSCPIIGTAIFAYLLQEQLSISQGIFILGTIFRILITGSQAIQSLSYKRFDDVQKYKLNYLNLGLAFLAGITGFIGLYQIIRSEYIFYSLILSLLVDYAQLMIKTPLLTIYFILHGISLIGLVINIQYFYIIQVSLLNFITLIDDSKGIKLVQACASGVALFFQ